MAAAIPDVGVFIKINPVSLISQYQFLYLTAIKNMSELRTVEARQKNLYSLLGSFGRTLAMKWMKWNTLALSMSVMFVLFAASADAVTVSSNVALFRPVTIESGIWEDELADPPWPEISVLTDDLNGAKLQTASELSGLWVNLEAEYDLERLNLNYRYGDLVDGAMLRGYAADQLTEVGTPITVNAGTYYWDLTDWNGVQWILLADEGDNPDIMTGTVRELRAYSQVECWTGSIGGTATGVIPNVSVTATSTYVGAAGVATESLCNNGGMTDQRGPVGDPDALSITSGAFWQPESNVTNATVTFELDATYNLDDMYIWNLNQTNHADRGIQHATIDYSLDGENYTTLADTNGEDLGNYTIPMVTENVQNAYSLAIDMAGIQAKYIRIEGLDSWGGTNIGLSEVRFYGEVVSTNVPGDTDNDGDVDADDAAVLGNNWGRSDVTAGASEGDFNDDGYCNAKDASILAANWGTGVGESNLSAVPEPIGATLLLSLLFVLGILRPRRTTH